MTGIAGYKQGLWAELIAEVVLRLKGYSVLARRYKTPVGEIDLVLRRRCFLVFVEVKWRDDVRAAAEAVHSQNRQRVRQAAALYLQRHPAYNHLDVRFDAMLLSPGVWPKHIVNAWGET